MKSDNQNDTNILPEVRTRFVAYVTLPLAALILAPLVMDPVRAAPLVAGLGLNMLGLGIWSAVSKKHRFGQAVPWWARLILFAINLVIAIALHLSFGAGAAFSWYLSAAVWFFLSPFGLIVMALPFV